MTKAVRIATVTTGSTHQLSLRRVGTSGPPRGAPMTTGVVVAFSTVVVTRTSSVPAQRPSRQVLDVTPLSQPRPCDPTVRLTRTSKT